MVLVIHQVNAKTREVSKVATVQQGKNNPKKTGGGERVGGADAIDEFR